MSRLTKNILLFSFSFALLVAVLMQSACQDDEDVFTREDFVDALKGEWYVLHFWRTPVYPPQTDYIQCSRISDSVMYRYINTTTYFAVNDPFVCTLPEIENMQSWTISGNPDDLTLSASDLCGNNMVYKLEYSNYRYEEGKDWHKIFADVDLIGTDTTWSLEEFWISDTYMQFNAANDSLSLYDYVLSR